MERWIQKYFTGETGNDIAGLHFAWGGPLGGFLALGLLCLLTGAVGVYTWRRLGGRMPRRERVTVTLLRSGVVALTLFLLFDPSLVGQRINPGEQAVALLFDDSRSMRIAGGDGRSAGERLRAAWRGPGARVEEQLRKRFQLVHYGVGVGAERIDDASSLEFGQPVSNLSGAIEGVLNDLAGADVAAVVLLSDGVQQPDPTMDLDALAAAGVPVYTVSANAGGAWRDLELSGLSVKRSSFDKSPVTVTMRVAASGLDGETLVAEVLDGENPVAAETFRAAGGTAVHEARLEFIPTRQEWITYRARVRHGSADDKTGLLPDRDRIAQNNERSFLVDNRAKEYRILYLSGSPTWENKFYRRAVEADKQLRVTTLVRISRAEKTFVFRGNRGNLTNPLFQGFDDSMKDQPRYDEAVFLRLGPDGSELTTGYPDEPEALFPFHLVIWGDIEHNFFSTTQLELTRNFVMKRGGTLLLMGGPRSFAEGGFGNTIIDAMLPVVLRAAKPGDLEEVTTQPFTVTPSADGLFSGAWMLDPAPERNRELWESLSNLYGLNSFALTRAGASVMATVSAPNAENDGQPFFAIQQYGEGRCAVMATGQTWPWHMGTPEGDTRYERLWRQLTRALVDGVPEPVVLRTKAEEYPVDEPIELEFLVRDKRFAPRETLRMSLTLTGPAGETRALDVEESIQETGVYSARFTPETPGAYGLTLSAVDEAGEVVGTLDERLSVVPDLREFHNARSDGEALRRLAEATGGRHFELDELEQLADHIPVRAIKEPNEELQRWRLWHWPPFLAVLLTFLTAEWYLRRKKGQP
jgi:uncharacterized membrane protein